MQLAEIRQVLLTMSPSETLWGNDLIGSLSGFGHNFAAPAPFANLITPLDG